MAIDKISFVKTLTNGEATDEQAAAFLTKAEAVILRRLYPFGKPENAVVPEDYEMLQCELSVRYFYRMGSEAEISHGENGVNRTYGSVNDEDLLREIMPYAKLGW